MSMPEDAVKRALRLLERRDMSRRELLDKLTQKGVTPEDAAGAADRMAALGFIDDARYAPLVVRYAAAKGWGRRRIEAELTRRGVGRDLWDEAFESLPPPDDTLDRLLRARLRGADPRDRAALKKATDYLMRRGFSWGDIESALTRLKEESES